MFYILGLLLEVAYVIHAKSESSPCKNKNINYIPVGEDSRPKTEVKIFLAPEAMKLVGEITKRRSMSEDANEANLKNGFYRRD